MGILTLVGAVVGLVVAAIGLQKSPEKIRHLSAASLLTSGGLLGVGFGLAFAVGLAQEILVAGGISAYLYGFALSLSKRRRRTQEKVLILPGQPLHPELVNRSSTRADPQHGGQHAWLWTQDTGPPSSGCRVQGSISEGQRAARGGW
jgi:hypothetical protein